MTRSYHGQKFKSILNLHCSILASHGNYNKICTVQKKSKQKVGCRYYKTAVSVNRCFLLLYKKYISEK